MYQSWRQQVHAAEEALKRGRLDEACRLLREGELDQTLPGKKLAVRVFESLLNQVRLELREGRTKSAWKILESATELQPGHPAIEGTRDQVIDRSLKEIENYLAADEPETAVRLMKQLQQHGVSSERLSSLTMGATCLQSAKDLSRQGEFARADEQLATALQLLPEVKVIERWRAECQRSMMDSRSLKDQLHYALIGDDWDRSLQVADQLLELSPDCRLAQDARRRAWKKVDEQDARSVALQDTDTYSGDSQKKREQAVTAESPAAAAESMLTKSAEARFLLWVDAVGGYLVCLSPQVIIGQAMPETEAHIPILGDLFREHALIRREGEDYLIEPIASVSVEGQQIKGKTLLHNGDEIDLGNGVVLRFCKPHALSATARLEFVSRHRTHPWADGVLLMAESCVLGPNWHNHVVCRDWADDVVLFRQDDGLYCRSMNTLEIDGEPHDGTGPITYSSRIVGEDFSMSLEEI